MKLPEKIVQQLCGGIYLAAFALLLVPVVLVNVVWHAALDLWDICDGHLHTSKRI